MKIILLITLLFVSINSRIVYMCHDDPFKDEQCLKKEKLGSNTFYWVRKCKGAKVCVTLPYYDRMIGACSIKVRSHYDGESCANGNKCTSGICGGTKCKGLNPGVACEVGLGQCQKGYLCRYSAKDDGTADTSSSPTCQKPLDDGANCDGFASSSNSLQGTTFRSRYFHPSNNPCKIGSVCATIEKTESGTTTTSTTCVGVASQAKNVKVNNPMACETGYTLNGVCSDATDDENNSDIGSTDTSRGGTFTKYSNITKAFDEWKKEWSKKNIKEDDAIYEAYRYTKNKKKINEAFFRYTHAAWVADADECAFDYLWKHESANSLKFSLMIFILALLF